MDRNVVDRAGNGNSFVALRKESVDRNSKTKNIKERYLVALRKESVDRNTSQLLCTICTTVALRKESVDRNSGCIAIKAEYPQSLSARRAWIEIPCGSRKRCTWVSLSARRAWIEIPSSHSKIPLFYVALRKESVDRNRQKPGGGNLQNFGRSPQGERG